jgi:hypothetical protein
LIENGSINTCFAHLILQWTRYSFQTTAIFFSISISLKNKTLDTVSCTGACHLYDAFWRPFFAHPEIYFGLRLMACGPSNK